MSKHNIQIRFVGNNSQDVTGSCIWIKTPHRQILLECGLYQAAGKTLDVYNINNAPFEFKAKAGSDGRMFGSISTKQVADEIKKVLNIEVDKRKFVDPIPVNAFGTTLLKIDLYKGIIATVKVHVSASNM